MPRLQVLLSAIIWVVLVLVGHARSSIAQETAGKRAEGRVSIAGKAFELESPTVSGEQTPQEQLASLQGLVGKVKWKAFSRDSVVAPVEIDLDYLRNETGDRIGHRVYLGFIAHVPFASLRDQNVSAKLTGSASEKNRWSGRKLSETELTESEITPGDNETVVAFQVPLLEEVSLQGVLRVQLQQSDRSIEYQFRLDDRFSVTNERTAESSVAESSLANTWRRIEDPNAGDQPYSGLVGFFRITQLSEPADTCYVEARLLMHEPTDWFNGSNFLRSKLPLMLQELARNFRRRL